MILVYFLSFNLINVNVVWDQVDASLYAGYSYKLTKVGCCEFVKWIIIDHFMREDYTGLHLMQDSITDAIKQCLATNHVAHNHGKTTSL